VITIAGEQKNAFVYRIFTAQGIVVKTGVSTDQELDLRDLASGMYYAELSLEGIGSV
jgi:hypothetical protein